MHPAQTQPYNFLDPYALPHLLDTRLVNNVLAPCVPQLVNGVHHSAVVPVWSVDLERLYRSVDEEVSRILDADDEADGEFNWSLMDELGLAVPTLEVFYTSSCQQTVAMAVSCGTALKRVEERFKRILPTDILSTVPPSLN
ncbi:hypothetical protein JCM8547_003092 [Rhodosporidiobolus lusitaniae]